jgi:hypothetical protein
MDPSPAMMKVLNKKYRKYSPLLHLAHVVHLKRRDNKRLTVFVVGAVS